MQGIHEVGAANVEKKSVRPLAVYIWLHRSRHSGIHARPACLCPYPLLEHQWDCRGKKLNFCVAGAAAQR